MTATWLNDVTTWVATNPGWLLAALFATALIESLAIAGIIVPGVALLFAFAALAGKTGLALPEALLWAGLGAVAGDVISFGAGRLLQGRLNSVWPFSRYPGLIARGESFFNTHGGKSVVIGRFVGPIRPIIPLIAGALTMPWQRFLTFNLLSAVGWALVYILPGYVVGSALASDIKPPPHFYPVLAISGAALVLVYLIMLRLRLGVGEGSWIYQRLEARMSQYDTTHRFWRLYSNERPSQQGEFPLPSLLLTLASLALFAGLAQLVSVSDQIQQLNTQVLQWFSALRQPLLDLPMIAVTLLGDPAVLVGAAVVAVLLLAFRGYYAAALHIGVAALVTGLSVWWLKAGLGIGRPDLVMSAPESGAYPSGHTAGMTVLVTLAASFIAGENRNRQRWQHYLILSLPLLPVALSRLYLGVHWFTDVLGGLFLGLAITGATRASYSRYDRVALSPDIFTWAAGLGWLLFVAAYLTGNWEAAILAYTPQP
ncbi:bifunctional DedA family/phosphatase PAP2 family protein [Marinobacter daepoensis]|uniref:bifunctional DedA family/phosphatase PAP2 family protein n=1 Tax=Marinobacter daepoensis TaxID=262077 RepID=UPI001C96BA84|nr:bifunctional DedA family/phosphatase PAP2 family protein [Marinobacter daepoensis]MBY6034173.1 bifunctional DedA family/phosphatase PAP2 family protein [Marinobacter daepoensis]